MGPNARSRTSTPVGSSVESRDDAGEALGERVACDRGVGLRGCLPVAEDVNRAKTGGARPGDVEFGAVADVDRLVGGRAECVEFGPERAGVGFAGLKRARDHDRIEQVLPAERVELRALGTHRAVGQQPDAVLLAEPPDERLGPRDRHERVGDRVAVGVRERARRGVGVVVGEEVVEDGLAGPVGEVSTVGVEVRLPGEGGTVDRRTRLVEQRLAVAFGDRERVIEIERDRPDGHTTQ